MVLEQNPVLDTVRDPYKPHVSPVLRKTTIPDKVSGPSPPTLLTPEGFSVQSPRLGSDYRGRDTERTLSCSCSLIRFFSLDLFREGDVRRDQFGETTKSGVCQVNVVPGYNYYASITIVCVYKQFVHDTRFVKYTL